MCRCFLWKKIKNGLSAGRVQSVATRIIVEREEEIRAFAPEEYWHINALLKNAAGESFTAHFYGDVEGKKELHCRADVDAVLDSMNDSFAVLSVKRSVKHRKPQPPFVTSTLQQEANRRLGFQSSRTMMIAQELYEGVNIGEKSTHGLITYMRTDSLRISDEAREAAKNVICSRFGNEYYPETPNQYKMRKNAQDAHEAIRPSDPALLPEDVKGKLSADQYKLYKLIWERFMASQMAAAAFDTVSADILSGAAVFRANGNTVRFRGYMALYDDADEEEAEGRLPELNEGARLSTVSVTPEQKFTQPPPRYTEGSLIRVLEKGIGRPSTYTATITTIVNRGYVKREGKVLIPTDLGFVTTDLMKNAFTNIVDYNFTAEMEADLDRIESGDENHIEVIRRFYADFESQLKRASETLGDDRIALQKVELDMVCEKCGARMVEREGRYGKFAACPNYPKCKNTKRLDAKEETAPAEEDRQPEIVADDPCPICGGEMIARKGAFGTFFACRKYPDCKGSMPFYRDSGILCPDCGKRILIKQTRKHKTYYCCEKYPECSFSSWDIPTGEKCPGCGSALLRKKGKNTVYCKSGCGYSDGK